eukprot:UN09384
MNHIEQNRRNDQQHLTQINKKQPLPRSGLTTGPRHQSRLSLDASSPHGNTTFPTQVSPQMTHAMTLTKYPQQPQHQQQQQQHVPRCSSAGTSSSSSSSITTNTVVISTNNSSKYIYPHRKIFVPQELPP